MIASDLAATGLPIDVRTPDPGLDAIDGVIPETIIEPATPDAVAATLGWASEHQLSLVIRGAGTKTAWGRPPKKIDALLSMRRLNHVLWHRQGDLTVTVEAGAPLHALNQTLSTHGQWLPLDPPFDDRATIGGLLATNDSGPRRHRFGTPRDLVIGIQLATTDRHLSKSGGQVVKNVAGYDLSKLVTGSFGQLAVIVSATFKLSPLSAASSTLVFDRLDVGALPRVVDAVLASQLEPVAFEVRASCGSPGTESTMCLLRFESFADVVDVEVKAARARIGAVQPAIDVVTGEAEQRLWQQHVRSPWNGPGAVVRASWLPADLSRVVAQLPQTAAGCDLEMIGRIGVGAGLIRLDGPLPRQVEAIDRLRVSSLVGNIVVLRGDAELKDRVDVWGSVPTGGLLASVKRALDPNGTLGAGRGPV